MGHKRPGDTQILSISYLDRTCWLNRWYGGSKEHPVLSRIKYPPGSSITVKLFSSRTNSQQWPLMKELELGESNEWLSFINKESSHLINFMSILGAVKSPHACTRVQQRSVQYAIHFFYMGNILTLVIDVCLHCGGRANLSDGNSKCVLLPLRMCHGGSGWVFMFVLALAFSTYPALGTLKKTCPVPSSVHCPIVFHFPHCSKWKRNQHKHSIVKYEICTGNWKFSQNRPSCVMARRCWAERELQQPFRLQRCVLHFRWGAEATGLWVFSIIFG